MITKARKSIAAFKLREGMPIGCTVTLRGDRMYEFFDRLVNVSLPRVRDFRGVSTKSFDGRGNYTLGIEGSIDFPGDRLQQSRQNQRNEYLHHHHRQDRCRGSGAAEASRHAVPHAVERNRRNDGHYRQNCQRRKTRGGEGRQDAEAAVPASQPLFPVRAAARIFCANSSCAASVSAQLALAGEVPGVIKASLVRSCMEMRGSDEGMTTTDPIADMLTRIRNALEARHPKVDVPASRLKTRHREDSQGRRLHRQLQADRGRDQEVDPHLSQIHAGQRAGDFADRAGFAAGLPGVCRLEGSAARAGRPGDQHPDHAARRDDRDRRARKEGVGGEVLCHVW